MARMDARDVCAIGDALAEGLDGTTRKVEEMSDAVARRSFTVAGPARVLPQAIYDRITPRVYQTLRAVGPAAIRSGALGIGSAIGPEADRIHSSPRGKAFVSAVNGLVGDSLARRGNGLALRMTLRAGGADVRPTEAELAAAFPEPTGRLVIFVHGFGESDDSWRWYSNEHWGAPGLSYGELLRRELGFTPLALHYNSGRPIGANATELSCLLDDLATNWPGWVEEIVLVGHSAGAAVAHGALRHGWLTGAGWVARVSHLFSLGSPRSAQLAERTAQRAARALGRLPETRPLSDLLEGRSAGLKDLAAAELDIDTPEHVTAVLLDGEANGIGHFRLLNHPDVYRELKARLSVRTAPVPAPAAREGRYGRAAMALRGRRLSRRRSP
jgi:pimeloyl-ACP methyl ester carboxylesterase